MNKKKLAIVGVAVLAVVVGLLAFWLVKPGAESEPVPPSPAPTETASLNLDSDTKSGVATQEVVVGQNVAAITVNFDYDIQGEDMVVTSVGPATAENRTGWHAVARTATIDQDKVIYAQDDVQAVVPVTYQASVGAGYADYDCVVTIDLSQA